MASAGPAVEFLQHRVESLQQKHSLYFTTANVLNK